MLYTPKILAFSGSLRRESHNKRVVQVAAEGARQAGAEVTIFDLKDLPLPLYDDDLIGEKGFDSNAAEFQRILLAHDGLLISTPEYNGSITGALKNAIDWASRANGETKMGAVFTGKVAGIMAASPGGFGGIQCLGHLRSILSVLGVLVLPEQFAVGGVHDAFDDKNSLKDAKMHALLERHGANVAQTLKKLRS